MSASNPAATQFARNLRRARKDRNWSQSDLARNVWGEMVDKRGYTVARNRDLVSSYERGRYLPKAETLAEIALALGMTVQELLPPVQETASIVGEAPGALVTIQHTGETYARLNICTVVPLAVALKVIECLNEANAARPDATAANAR